MKSTLRLLFALVFGLGLLVAPSFAIVKQVTTVSATASTIFTPGPNIHTVVIQNNGSGNVRLTIDGGSVTGLTNPTATTGYKLVAGAQLVITYPGDKRPPVIRAILESGTTTTLDLVSDDAGSS